MKVLSVCIGFLLIFWVLPSYGQGYKDLENLALKATAEAEGADQPVEHINDGDFTTRWNAANDDTDTWVQFTWDTPQEINRVHVTEFTSRIFGHTIEYGEKLEEVKNLKMIPEWPGDAKNNHPGDSPQGQREPLEIPDHKLTFDTIATRILRYHVTEARTATLEPSVLEIEIFFDPKLVTPVRPAGCLVTTWARLKGK